ncbi:DM13 domain-containing protein [Pseudomonadota bacterium]
MRKKLILIVVFWTFILFGVAKAFWHLASPIWIDQVVSEERPNAKMYSVHKTGTFKDADSSHRGRGVATIHEAHDGQRIVSLADFAVTNGPDLIVYAVESDTISDSDSVLQSRLLNLGALKGNVGNQNYAIPADIDFEIGSIVIWCEQFSVLFSAAELNEQ